MSCEQNPTPEEKITLELHKEVLQVSKKVLETAKVNVYTNTYTKEKQVLVPIKYEELVIEKRIVNPGDDKQEKVETIRIPLSEERFEIKKHVVILEEVEVYKKKIEEHIEFSETLREEKIHIDTIGDIVLTNESTTDSQKYNR